MHAACNTHRPKREREKTEYTCIYVYYIHIYIYIYSYNVKSKVILGFSSIQLHNSAMDFCCWSYMP